MGRNGNIDVGKMGNGNEVLDWEWEWGIGLGMGMRYWTGNGNEVLDWEMGMRYWTGDGNEVLDWEWEWGIGLGMGMRYWTGNGNNSMWMGGNGNNNSHSCTPLLGNAILSWTANLFDVKIPNDSVDVSRCYEPQINNRCFHNLYTVIQNYQHHLESPYSYW